MTKLSKGKHIAAFPGFVDTFNALVDFVENFGVSGEGLSFSNNKVRLDLSSVGEEVAVITGIDISKTESKSEITIHTRNVRLLSVGDEATDTQTVMEIPEIIEMETKEYTLTDKRVIADVSAASDNLEMKIKTVTLMQPSDETPASDVTKKLQSGDDSNIKFTQSGTGEDATIEADVYYK